ncbi:MAG: hypothetical protein LBF57_01840 [Holosporaceae bacterium]|jgi:hypothetical protein|nr:hypothetical protein [Holosporaceae bacterium]
MKKIFMSMMVVGTICAVAKSSAMQGGSSTLDANPITEQSEGLFFVVGGGVAFVNGGVRVDNDSDSHDKAPKYTQVDGTTTATRGAFFIGLKKVFSNNVVVGIEANVNAGPANSNAHVDRWTGNPGTAGDQQVSYELYTRSNGIVPGASISLGYNVLNGTTVFASAGVAYSKCSERYQDWSFTNTNNDMPDPFILNNGGISPVFGIGMSHRINPKMNVEVSASYASGKTQDHAFGDGTHVWLTKKGSVSTRLAFSYAIPIAR